MIWLRHQENSRTAAILAGLLRQRGIRVGGIGAEAVVCYGVSYGVPQRGNGGPPTLNANCSRYNKLEQLQHLAEFDVHVPAAWENPMHDQEQWYPCFARKLQHTRGTDIRVCLQPSDAQFYIRNGWSYFTQFVPSATEYRTWIYRRRHLGTYEKRLTHPEWATRQNVGYGRNYHRGYSFELVRSEDVPRNVVEISSQAVDALGLDFGAVDVLLSTDNRPVVLEVNTAPGVEGEGRQVIQALADKIARWVTLGYPRRNGDRE